MKYLANGIPYGEALKLMHELRQSSIESRIVSMNIAIFVADSQVDFVKALCRKHGANIEKAKTER
jgi:hypothetical protein